MCRMMGRRHRSRVADPIRFQSTRSAGKWCAPQPRAGRVLLSGLSLAAGSVVFVAWPTTCGCFQIEADKEAKVKKHVQWKIEVRIMLRRRRSCCSATPAPADPPACGPACGLTASWLLACLDRSGRRGARCSSSCDGGSNAPTCTRTSLRSTESSSRVVTDSSGAAPVSCFPN